MRRVGVLFWVCSLAATSCKPSGATQELDEPRVEFGVFFGAQIQQRTELSLQLDESKQRLGFRLEFPSATARPLTIAWEVDFPTRRSGPHGPGNAPRGVRSQTAIMPAGANRFEQTIPLLPTDFPGTWNLRVKADGILVLDRPFRIVTNDDASASGAR